LLEGLVFGARAAKAMCESPRAADPRADRRVYVETSGVNGHGGHDDGVGAREASPWTIGRLRHGMWRFAGLFRTKATLAPFVAELDAAYDAAIAHEASTPPAGSAERQVTSLLTVSRLIARAALRREESRGGHFRDDFPARDDARWRVHAADVRVR
jgi:aspartate oxidase